MIFTEQERDVIRDIYFSTSLTEAQIEECFHGLSVVYTSAMLTNTKIVVPFLGEFRAKLNSQKISSDLGVINDVSLFSIPSEQFKKIVGQVSGEKAGEGVALTDSYNWLTMKLGKVLGGNINYHDSEE